MKDLKEKLKGTCVLNESVEMGAEIVKLYTEAGYVGIVPLSGKGIGAYYGIKDGVAQCAWTLDFYEKVITIDQLRSIVRGEKEESEYKKTLKRQLAKDFSDDLIPNRNYIYHGNERDMVKGNTYFVYKANPDYIELLDAYSNPHQFVRSEWPLFELVKAESVEFKEGEIVEANGYKDLREGAWYSGYRFIGKQSNGSFAVETNKGNLISVAGIRKIDPDADLKKIADRVIKDATAYNPHELVGGYYEESEVKQMLIEAMKRVKK